MGDQEENSRENVFNAPDCKCETVVVYLDRAEVSRSLTANLKEGENEVIIKDLSACIDKDSIRVEGRGAATISEVAFQTRYVSDEEKTVATEKGKQLQEKLQQEEKKQKILHARQHCLKKQRKVLDGFADNVVKMPTTTSESPPHTVTQQGNGVALLANLGAMSSFFDVYEKQSTRLDKNLQELEDDITSCLSEIECTRKNLNEISAEPKKEARELSVLLDAAEEGDVELNFSYVVSKAKWAPKYDIRVFGNDVQLKIQYYGMIQQATGEDWTDAKLCLSTAMPSIGGSVPDLGTQKLGFKRALNHVLDSDIDLLQRTVSQHNANGVTFSSLRRSKSLRKRRPQSAYIPAGTGASEAALNRSFDEALRNIDLDQWFKDALDCQEIGDVPLQVKESITSTMYEISRRSTIPADNVSHKVSVAIIDLKPTFEYECVPKKSQHAYLKAKVKNTSAYALLAGPTNIFLDNNFIAKAELKAVSPSEDFTCSLGVDPAIKVAYKPLSKFREQSGLISKSIATAYKQVIEVKNTHQEAIKILVIDQLPLSTEEKIKVTLQEPAIKHPEKYDLNKPIRLNKMNNIEWELEIGVNETKELHLRYNLEHPASEEIDVQVVHYSTQLSTSDA